MNILELSIMTASIATCTLVLGFRVGMGYQRAEDTKHIRKIKAECDRFHNQVRDLSLQAIDRAYELGKEHGESELHITFDEQDNDIHFGGF